MPVSEEDFGRRDVDDFSTIVALAVMSGVEGGYVSTRDLAALVLLADEALVARGGKLKE